MPDQARRVADVNQESPFVRQMVINFYIEKINIPEQGVNDILLQKTGG